MVGAREPRSPCSRESRSRIHLPPCLPAFSAELRPGVKEEPSPGAPKKAEGAFYLASVTPPEPSQLDKTLQRKCLALISPVMPFKVSCCLFIIAVLTTSVIALSIVLSDIRNWTLSQTFCVSLEASLAQFAAMEELDFLKRYKGPSDHWIGLRRESSHHIWKWTDNMEYNNTLAIRGGTECAFLNDNVVNSGRIYINRKWICSKPNSYVYSCQLCPHWDTT
nr:C-type lectin domain family 2 member E-like isoform X1 [Symphalangus syndactylus]